jgi:phosphoribosylformylglycinamidine synthase
MVTGDAGVEASVADEVALFDETPGRAVVETADPAAVREAFEGVAAVEEIGTATDDGALSLSVGDEELTCAAAEIVDLRDVIARELA